MELKNDLVAPCGLDCQRCELFTDNISDKLKQVIHEKMGVPVEDVPCRGCREEDGRHFHIPEQGCRNLECAKERRVFLCCECEEFPCELLAPVADQADRYPHNIKLYNLCRIKKAGLEKWLQEEAPQIRKKYFKARFVVGEGQKGPLSE